MTANFAAGPTERHAAGPRHHRSHHSAGRLTDADLMRLLSDARPAPRPGPDAARSARAQTLLADIMSSPRVAAEPRGAGIAVAAPAVGVVARVGTLAATARAALRRRWARVVAVLTALAAAAAGMFLMATPASARLVLLEAAQSAAAQPAQSGTYLYVRSRIEYPESLPFEREVWVSPDTHLVRDGASAAWRAFDAGESEIDPSDIRTTDLLAHMEGTPAGMPGPLFGDGARYDWQALADLPTDAAALRARLLGDTPPSGHGEAYDLSNAVASLLSESPADPELRRALWEVMATVPGIELLGRTTDSVGREVTGIALNLTGRRLGSYEWLLDPTDGRLLESRAMGQDGEVLYRSTVLEWGWRDTVPPVDPPLCGPGSEPYTSC